ncbi:ankyrin repeat protein [Seminavis robusta]|uniref:Ankyrin repeat protein n=1 Tax=Seminavis robusta TaxID=568900 RepID=A0A9N8E2G4_9STRA|nr:ankyrin repeat protein [Seminavis robusta]|eukprot:Sro478_g150940.1 ankyrin repeat protein (213) ;mRNA; f:9512-10150
MNNATATNHEGTAESPLLSVDDAIWIQGILQCVGVGQYAFVGPVSKKMNRLYKEYCTIELTKNPRKVKENPEDDTGSRSAEITDSLCSETFSSQPRAEYWLKDDSGNKTPDHHHVCNAIAKIGNLAVMQWARQKGFPWNKETCFHAARNGHLELLIWLRENGCPWDERTCSKAAEGGHLEILKWARENGCRWDEDTCARAAAGGHWKFCVGS